MKIMSDCGNKHTHISILLKYIKYYFHSHEFSKYLIYFLSVLYCENYLTY